MSSIRSIAWIVLSIVGFIGATTAQAANQLYRVSEVSWSVKVFGNECSYADPSPGPYCGNGAPESWFYSAVGLPQGVQCNPYFPRCPFSSTPTDGLGMFSAVGPTRFGVVYCAPWVDWQGMGTTARPARGETAHYSGMEGAKIPPLYRNPAFFTSGGAPGTTWCTAISTGFTPGGKGRVQAGKPVTGSLLVNGTGGAEGGFDFPAAGVSTGPGLRASGVVGELFGRAYIGAEFPGYTYTYATLRNDAGFFRPGSGPGDFSIKQYQGAKSIARTRVKQGAAKFGGTMTMLGALTSKVCRYEIGACLRGTNDWRYDAIGASVYNGPGLPITQGYRVYETAKYFHSAFSQTSTIAIEGSRFPWTTGSVTVTAVGRGPHKTIHYARGYDNRATTRTGYPYALQVGTLQLVTPVLTRWLQPAVHFETAGIGILRFVPEPRAWGMLAAGIALLGVGYRMRKPASAARDGR